jgi:hypothetical protein
MNTDVSFHEGNEDEESTVVQSRQVVVNIIVSDSDQEVMGERNNVSSSSLSIEFIADDDKGDTNDDDGDNDDKGYNVNEEKNMRNNFKSNKKISATSSGSNRSSREERIRVLWPPIGPSILSVASWGKDEAVKHHPILSIAITMSLWPTAFILAFIGAPIIAFDYALQSGYGALEDHHAPLIQNVEQGAANVVQIGKLYFLISKLMVKQSIQVGKRHIERRGGVQQVAQDGGSWALDRAIHPVESVGMAFNTLKTGTGMVVDAASFVKDVATRESID